MNRRARIRRRELSRAPRDRCAQMPAGRPRVPWTAPWWARPAQAALDLMNRALRPMGEWAWLRPIRLGLGIVSCADVRVWVSRYLDGDLPPRRVREMRAHLWGCRHCYSLVEFVRTIRALEARSLRPSRAPAALRRRIIRQTA